METGWYLKIADKEVGPLSARQLKAMAGKGQISPFDPIRKGTEGSWVAASSVKGLLPAAEPASGKPGPQAGSEPAATPAATSPGAAQGKLPVAKAVALPVARPAATPPPEAAPGSPTAGGFQIDTGQSDPTARNASRGGAALPAPRRRRRNDAIIVVVALLVVGLAAVAAGVVLSRRGVGAASGSAGETQDREAPKPKSEHEKVVIPGLDALLGEASPEGSGQADSETPAATEWTDASQSLAECGGVTVKIAAAQIGRPKLIHGSTGKAAKPRSDYLLLKLELANADKTEKREYTSWSVRDAGVRLVDNQDNAYSMKSFANQGLEVDGQMAAGTGSLNPEEVTSDVLLFEKPSTSATLLRLELPAAAFGEEGAVKFEIPMAMIAVEVEVEEEPETEKIAAKSDERAATKEPAMATEDDGGPISIPGMTDEQSMDDDEEEVVVKEKEE
ncbi:MAG: GYF domain-containing protein, partial [Planctomycetota bacterium]